MIRIVEDGPSEMVSLPSEMRTNRIVAIEIDMYKYEIDAALSTDRDHLQIVSYTVVLAGSALYPWRSPHSTR